MSDYDIDDTRYVELDMRFIVGTNMIHPHIWRVTKIDELQPKGIFKIIIKRDEYNEVRDNIELHVCDYYDDSGDEVIASPVNDDPSEEKIGKLWWAILRDKDSYDNPIEPPLIESNDTDLVKFLVINEDRYFVAEFSDEWVLPQWRIEYSDHNDDSSTLSDLDKQKYCDLLKITKHSDTAISIKPSKSKALIGKLFNLTVQDAQGEYKSSILDMEVRANENNKI